jgi:hypothetical protein
MVTIPEGTETIRVWAGGKSRAKYPMLLITRWRGVNAEFDGWWSMPPGNGMGGHGHWTDEYVESLLAGHKASGNRIEFSPEPEVTA